MFIEPLYTIVVLRSVTFYLSDTLFLAPKELIAVAYNTLRFYTGVVYVDRKVPLLFPNLKEPLASNIIRL